jgi:hypothetical protein
LPSGPVSNQFLVFVFGSWQAWNIYELFHTRYSLHKRAYQVRVRFAAICLRALCCGSTRDVLRVSSIEWAQSLVACTRMHCWQPMMP